MAQYIKLRRTNTINVKSSIQQFKSYLRHEYYHNSINCE